VGVTSLRGRVRTVVGLPRGSTSAAGAWGFQALTSGRANPTVVAMSRLGMAGLIITALAVHSIGCGRSDAGHASAIQRGPIAKPPELLENGTSNHAGHSSEGSGQSGAADAELDKSGLASTEIRLHRTSCYGCCPEYSITIFGTGQVIYEGSSCVVNEGVHEGTISLDALQSLIDSFSRQGFFELREYYRQQVTDQSTALLFVRIGNVEKQVENYWSGDRWDPWGTEDPDWAVHETLDALAKEVDDAVQIEKWIGNATARKRLHK
jgi:Domain of unknown function (DUF6438)